MPSVASFIRDLLSEDMYDSSFSSKIDERINHLNAAQLQGMYNHLKSTQDHSKTVLWKEANSELIRRIEDSLRAKTTEANKVKKTKEEKKLKEKNKRRLAKEAYYEKRRVMKMIEQNARQKAEEEVKQDELKRKADEKAMIIKKVFQGEERRNRWLKWIAVGFVVSIIVISIVVSNVIILAPLIFGVVCITSILVYKALNFTEVHPAPVNPEFIQNEIEKKQDKFIKKALDDIREKERKFQEMMKKDRKERKRRRELTKEKIRQEKEYVERQRMERIANTQEIHRQMSGFLSRMASINSSFSQTGLEGDDPDGHDPQSLTQDREESLYRPRDIEEGLDDESMSLENSSLVINEETENKSKVAKKNARGAVYEAGPSFIEDEEDTESTYKSDMTLFQRDMSLDEFVSEDSEVDSPSPKVSFSRKGSNSAGNLTPQTDLTPRKNEIKDSSQGREEEGLRTKDLPSVPTMLSPGRSSLKSKLSPQSSAQLSDSRPRTAASEVDSSTSTPSRRKKVSIRDQVDIQEFDSNDLMPD